MLFVRLLVCVALTFGVFVQGDRFVRMEPEITKFASSKWVQEKRLCSTDTVTAFFVLKKDESAVKQLESILLDRSSPSSPNYGQWLRRDDVVARVAPSDGALKKVLDYLASHGIKGDDVKVGALRDSVQVKMPVKIANSMLQTEFAPFRSLVHGDVSILRVTKPYYLPAEIAEVVSLVDDIVRFPSMRNLPLAYDRSASPNSQVEDASPFDSCGSKCSGDTTPDVLQEAYGYPSLTSSATGNSVSVAEFQGQYYDDKDLENFSESCGVTTTVTTTIGGNKEKLCELGGCVEALLDIEYIGALTYPIPLTVIYSSQYSILDWIDSVLAMSNPPLVHSVSYGNDEVQQTSTEYMYNVNTQFMAAGSMGLSILFAAGDQGVWGRTGTGSTFHPDFPASSPYVTAVGGTNFQEKSTIGAETTWDCGGGGFSDTFPQPSWQASAVSNYLSLAQQQGVLPQSSLFNATGRAYPDVSALGGQTNPYCVSDRGGKFAGVAGTSASCPVVAGIFAQLNNLRLANGQPSLGFLNPLIYSNPQCFNDVNDGSLNNCYKGYTGFAALNGWDPATGFGSPNYSCLAGIV